MRSSARPALRDTDASGNAQPAWSPSGQEIAHVSSGERFEENEADLEIYVMRADGRVARR